MERRRLKHEVITPLQIIKGPQFPSNEELFIRTGTGRYAYDFRTGVFTYNGSPLEPFPIIRTIAEWYAADQAKHRIDAAAIISAVLTIDLTCMADAGGDRRSLFRRLLLRAGAFFDPGIACRISAEMIIRTGTRTYARRIGRGFSFGWITRLARRWDLDREDAQLRVMHIASLLLAFIGLLLARVSTYFTLLSAPFSILTSLFLFDRISRAFFRKEFNPPRKFEHPADAVDRRWSDWLLFVPYVALAVYGIFLFGKIADLIRHEDVWRFG